MAEMCTQDALSLEPDLLGDALGRDVVGIGDELDTRQLEFLERVSTRRRSARVQMPWPRAGAAIQYPILAR